MEKERLEGLIIDYIDDTLNAVDRQKVEAELLSNPQARKLYDELKVVITAMDESATLTPPADLRTRFDATIAEEMRAQKPGSILFTPSFYRIAAAVALLVLGAGAGFWISHYNEQRESLARMQEEMELTRRELAATKAMMLDMLGNDQSASQRIRGINVSLEISAADDEIISALFTTLHEDPNTNVRLSALDALIRFRAEPDVRRRLIKSLSTQSDPMVQIRLIQLMVEMKEKGVVEDLQKIVDDDAATKAVKDEAYTGILKLS